MDTAFERVFQSELDRNSITPLYMQIADRLLQMVRSGELAPGDQLPPELDLAERFEVGRVTVRKAIDELTRERLLVRRRGKGTFIAERKIERKLVDVASFTARMEALGLSATSQLMEVQRLSATRDVARKLHLAEGAPIVAITRLRFINGDPAALETSDLSLDRFPGLDEAMPKHSSLYRLLAEEYGVSAERSDKTLEITTATEREAAHLGVSQGTPLFLLRATVYFGELPIEHAKILLRGDRFRFEI